MVGAQTSSPNLAASCRTGGDPSAQPMPSSDDRTKGHSLPDQDRQGLLPWDISVPSWCQNRCHCHIEEERQPGCLGTWPSAWGQCYLNHDHFLRPRLVLKTITVSALQWRQSCVFLRLKARESPGQPASCPSTQPQLSPTG